MPQFFTVATPIGNLEDITLRALSVLREVDIILCEDTRVGSKLLSHFDIKKTLDSYHHHSSDNKTEQIITWLSDGKKIALISDAGTPGISDPGGKLIETILSRRAEIESRSGEDLAIVPIPGASAIITALSVSGFPTDKFIFLGFLPHKKGRQTAIRTAIESPNTVIFYESKHRIVKLLQELTDLLGEEADTRKLVVARELTKMYETFYRGTAREILEIIKKGGNDSRGEFVVILSA